MAEDIDPNDITVIELIWAGKTAEVYLGACKGKAVAVMQLLWKRSEMKIDERRGLERKTSILAKVSHPRPAQLYGLCTSHEMFQLVVEFCQGGTLFDLLHDSPVGLSLRQLAKMSTDFARAIEYLHGFFR